MKIGKYYKMPKWAIERIDAIAKAYEITQTEALLRCLDQGSKWHKSRIKKEIDPAFDWEPKKPGVVLEDYNPNDDYMQHLIEIAKAKWIDE